MTDARTQADLEDSDVQTDFSDELSAGDVSGLIDEVEVDIPDNDPISLRDMMLDVTAGHYELDSYKRGGLTFAQALDDRIEEAEAAGNQKLAGLLAEVRRAAFGLYLRVRRGDAELEGDIEGKYSGHLDRED